MQILREAIANVTRVGYLANPDNASTLATLAELKNAAPAADVTLIPVEVRSVGDFDPAFAAMLRERPDALLVSNDPFHQLHIGRIMEFLAKNRLPGMFQSKESVAAGGLMDGTSRLSRDDGERIFHYSFLSTFAEACVVPERSCVPIPPDVPFEIAAEGDLGERGVRHVHERVCRKPRLGDGVVLELKLRRDLHQLGPVWTGA